MKEIIFLFVLFVANVIQAITGFAGTVLAMPPSIYLLGMDNAKVVLNVMALLSGLMIAVMSYHHMNKKEVIKICVCMVAGMAIGIQICKTVPSEQILLIIYGVIILLIAGKNLLCHRQRTLPKAFLLVILLLAGVIHGMFVSGGALLVVYAAQVLKEKEEFRATLAPVWVVLNSILLVSQVRQGVFYRGKYQVNFNQYYSFVYGDLAWEETGKKGISESLFEPDVCTSSGIRFIIDIVAGET